MNPARRVRPAQPLADQPEDDLVGHELARVHGGLGPLAEFGAALDGVAQQVAGRHLRDALFVAQPLGLRALAGTGCAEQYESHSSLIQDLPRTGHPTGKWGHSPFPL